MIDFQFKKLPKQTTEILVKIPQSVINQEYQKAFTRLQKKLQLEGFRQGHVPRSLAEKHLKKDDIYQELIRDFIPRIYHDALTKEKLQPIINPKIDLIKAKEKEDWLIKFTIAEKPKIVLNDYKKAIKEAKANLKKEKIWIPGQSDQSKTNPELEKQKSLNLVLETLLRHIKIEISDLIIEEELNHRLTQLLDDIKKIGLTVDAYLKSKNLTLEQLKSSYIREITDSFKLEFALQQIADKEAITVDKAEMDKLLSTVKDEKERQQAQQNAYFYAALLRKQKTIDFLLSL